MSVSHPQPSRMASCSAVANGRKLQILQAWDHNPSAILVSLGECLLFDWWVFRTSTFRSLWSAGFLYQLPIITVLDQPQIWSNDWKEKIWALKSLKKKIIQLGVNIWFSDCYVWQMNTYSAKRHSLKALRYKSKGRGFDSRWGHLIFQWT
jgi:hypothetical protein